MRARRRFAGAQLLRAFADCHPDALFVEIGANNGEAYDHLAPYVRSRNWRGVMVEPVPFLFERLRENYGDLERVVLENVAIADRDGRLPFYAPRPDAASDQDLPAWYPAIGSFSREVVLRLAREIPDLEQRIERIEVPCMTFESLCGKHGIDELDLLVIDTEGYDWEIVRNLDLEARRPRLLVYEHYHLTDGQQADARAHLASFGYETMEEFFDTFCLDTRVEDGLTQAWRELRPRVPAVSIHRER